MYVIKLVETGKYFEYVDLDKYLLVFDADISKAIKFKSKRKAQAIIDLFLRGQTDKSISATYEIVELGSLEA